MVLTITLLNYGSRLEKILASLKQKRQSLATVELRIFLLTVILSLLLLASSSTQLLCAWKIISDVTTQWKLLTFVILTETIPTFAIAIFLTRK
jgi:uncharacterized membrane protein (DUF485 family)